tara:strand:- start:62 stop:676 length:615 start_codon:yes stop_codon:yes gene_type:complete
MERMEGTNDKELSLESIFIDFNHPNPNINNRSVYLMIRDYYQESLERLINNFGSSDLLLRRKSIKAITEFGEEAVNSLLAVLYSRNSNIVSISCLKTLTIMNSKYTFKLILNEIPKIVELFSRDDDPLVILSLISFLRQSEKDGLEYLVSFSKDSNILKAKAAITAIAEIDDPRSKSCLRRISRNKHLDIILTESAIAGLNSKI